MREIGYRPKNVRETLVELKDSSELAVDLAYAAVLLDDADLAREVLELEERVADLQYLARISLMLAARRAADAERLVGVFQTVDTAVGVASAAGDVAEAVVGDVGLPEALRSALPEAHEPVFRATVAADSELAGVTLGEADLQVNYGVRVTAVRRGGRWLFGPDRDDRLRAGDVVIGVGPEAGVAELHEALTGEPHDPPAPGAEAEFLERAVETVMELRRVSELAVGLAYSAALYDSDALAEEVQALERESDALQDDLETWVIDAVPQVDEPQNLRGLLHLGTAAEAICDAALDTAEVVLREGEMHPVYAGAMRDAAEVVTSVRLAEGSPLAGEPVGDVELEAETGMVVLAVRRDDRWTFDPDEAFALAAGDAVVARGPRGGVGRLRELAEA